jgi:hypothetical protein
VICVAPTYPLLWDAPIPSFKKVFPESLGGNSPERREGRPDYSVDMNIRQGGVMGRIHLEVAFRSIADKDLEEFVRGVENTAWWLPEMDQAPDGLVSLAAEPRRALSRARPPARSLGGWRHLRRRLRRRQRPGGRRLVPQALLHRRQGQEADPARGRPGDCRPVFFQPPGILADGSANPNAENLHNLRKIKDNYYAQKAATMDDYDVNRLLKCNPGWSRYGKPVHPHFDHLRHVSGADRARRQPGAAHRRRLRQHAEARGDLFAAILLQPAPGHGRNLAGGPADRPGRVLRRDPALKDTRFRDVKHAYIVVDPAAAAKTTKDRQISYAQEIQGLTGIEVRLAPTNDPGMRRTAVDQALKRSAGPGEPGLLVDPVNCPHLIEALGGGYRFKKLGDAYSPQPEKNDHSHEAEALQYDLLDSDGMGAAGGFIPPHEGAGDGGGVILSE